MARDALREGMGCGAAGLLGSEVVAGASGAETSTGGGRKSESLHAGEWIQVNLQRSKLWFGWQARSARLINRSVTARGPDAESTCARATMAPSAERPAKQGLLYSQFAMQSLRRSVVAHLGLAGSASGVGATTKRVMACLAKTVF